MAGENWYSDWTYRKAVTVDNSGNASELTDYQVKIEVAYNSHILSNFNDIRFTDSDGDTLLNHWREIYIEYSTATFWVKVPTIPASASKTIYMYYGKAGASSASDDANTFITGADFNDGSTTGLTINTAGSAVAEVPTISSEQLYGLRIDDWLDHPDNPLIPVGGVGEWDAAGVRDLSIVIAEEDNSIVKDSGTITAYYYGYKSGYAERSIGKVTSTDEGYSWTKQGKVIGPSGENGSWYKSHIQSPSVIKRTSDGLLMMLAFGIEDGTISVGVLTSNDGDSWSDQGQKLTLDQFQYDESNELAEAGVPHIIKRSSGDFLMLFEGRKEAANTWRIFAATSSDFVGDWTPYNDGDPIFQETGSGWESVGVANPHFIEVEDDEFVLVYNGIAGDSEWKIGFASTTDFSNWTRYSGNPVIEGSDGWKSAFTETAFLGKEKSTNLRFYYQGFSAAGPQIGMAIASQNRRLHVNDVTVNDGWVVGTDLDGTSEFIFDVLCRESSDGSNNSVAVMGCFDFASVPSPMANTSWNPGARFFVARTSPTSPGPNKFYIEYKDTGGTSHFWNGSSWGGSIVYFGGPGKYKVEITDDGTNYKVDIKEYITGDSILANVASIAKSSVKAFSDGRVLVLSEPYTNYYALGQYFDNFILREYTSPEPTSELGEEQGVPESIEISGLIAAQSSVAGALKIIRELAGSSGAQSGVTGFLRLTRELTGSLSGESSIEGVPKCTKGIAGSINIQSSTEGILRTLRKLIGTVEAQSTLSSFIKSMRGITGSISGISGISADLSLESLILLVGGINAQSSASASMTLTRKLAGSLSGQSSIEGSIKQIRSLAGIINGTTNISGVFYVPAEVLISGAINAKSNVDGIILAPQYVLLIGSTEGVSLLQGILQKVHTYSDYEILLREATEDAFTILDSTDELIQEATEDLFRELS